MAVRLLLLVPGYFAELGFWGFILLAGIRAGRRGQLDEPQRTALFFAGATLIVTTFLRSTLVANNDFGWRALLIGQFFLVLLGVAWLEGGLGLPSRRVRRTMLAMLWIGVAGTVYQAIGLRVFLPVEDALGRAGYSGLAQRALALRRAGDAIEGRLSEDAVLQFNTAQPGEFFHYAQVMQAGRQMANGFPDCDSAFGGSRTACAPLQAGVARIFTPAAGRAMPAQSVRQLCGQLGITDLEATQWDGVWFDRSGWVWTLPAEVDTGAVRVVHCGR